ncbi:hypothetical protein G6F57_013546 [Rhizopus arrhizus]|uniref:Uncharacterized protein n=1 Tax=Rhizopus oryzae TaxID=64495 RepID=A0A9P6WXL3_RHIOR|nr:hypothetical protein G6F23_011990 [Rhizopus arrhizus]KAG1414336.1 hypothetical protein G6F58_007005 [Rhizopus delemar]KAG0846643.1 hypothetical protein G6F17_013257 [Rhizopus arrhizus]KAG0905104.1 hypothetical protein G6F33_012427 [Rhizopus arrhizus]KAG0928297.1 hypothetical protein G6F30_012414 [Rhizopus arrhizus]
MWVKHCYLVSKETIRGQDSGSPLSPIMVLSLFLAEQKPSLHLHSHPHDPTIIQLYETAFELVCHDQVFEQNYSSSIETICNTNEQLFKRAIDKISSGMDMDRLKRICERGIEYNREIKHRLLNDSSSTSSQELDYPDSLQLGPPQKKSATHTISNEDFEFVQQLKNNSTGRMNWKLCLQMGQNQNLLASVV